MARIDIDTIRAIRKIVESTVKEGTLEEVHTALERTLEIEGTTISTLYKVLDAYRVMEKVPYDTPSPYAKGSSAAPDYPSMTVKELRSIASERGIKNVGSMNKAKLVEAIS